MAVHKLSAGLAVVLVLLVTGSSAGHVPVTTVPCASPPPPVTAVPCASPPPPVAVPCPSPPPPVAVPCPSPPPPVAVPCPSPPPPVAVPCPSPPPPVQISAPPPPCASPPPPPVKLSAPPPPCASPPPPCYTAPPPPVKVSAPPPPCYTAPPPPVKVTTPAPCEPVGKCGLLALTYSKKTTIFEKLVRACGPDVVAIWENPHAQFSVLAPVDDAFKGVDLHALLNDNKKLRYIVGNHILWNVHLPTDLTQCGGKTYKTLSSTYVKFHSYHNKYGKVEVQCSGPKNQAHFVFPHYKACQVSVYPIDYILWA